MLRLQDRCISYHAPSDQVVLSASKKIQRTALEWATFYAALSPPGGLANGTLFMHELRSPGGQRRLVVIEGQNQVDPVLGFAEIAMVTRVFEPGSAFTLPKEVVTGLRTQNLQVTRDSICYAGQPDVSDASHFTIQIAEGQRERMIDGWLREDDHIIIEERATTPVSTTAGSN